MDYLHFTPSSNVADILEHGLRANSLPIGTVGVEWATAFFDCSPIYVTKADSLFIQIYGESVWRNFSSIEVDVTGLALSADLPSLVDLGAIYGDGMLLVTKSPKLKELAEFSDDYGWLEIEHLVEPGSPVAEAAIKITKTAAYAGNIPPSRLCLAEQFMPVNSQGVATRKM
jgi:hypothetical protein